MQKEEDSSIRPNKCCASSTEDTESIAVRKNCLRDPATIKVWCHQAEPLLQPEDKIEACGASCHSQRIESKGIKLNQTESS
jgi:hypothetical protein